MQIDFENLSDEQKEMIFKLGILKITESVFEGIDPIEKLQKNMNLLKDKSGLSDDQIWECYEFLSTAVIALGRPKVRSKIGFRV
ncbi:MAG TPA: hypothetical protein VG621_00210 [Candidatus Paceibacterota bacterium]|nr:hypothetical protein [Candidatus Paceibacterota bacterium]